MNAVTFAIAYTLTSSRLWLRDRMSERGASAVEYGLLVGLIAVVIAAAVLALGGNLNSLFGKTATCVGTPNTTNCP